MPQQASPQEVSRECPACAPGREQRLFGDGLEQYRAFVGDVFGIVRIPRDIENRQTSRGMPRHAGNRARPAKVESALQPSVAVGRQW